MGCEMRRIVDYSCHFDHIAVTEGGWVVDLEKEIPCIYMRKVQCLLILPYSMFMHCVCMCQIALDIQIWFYMANRYISQSGFSPNAGYMRHIVVVLLHSDIFSGFYAICVGFMWYDSYLHTFLEIVLRITERRIPTIISTY